MKTTPSRLTGCMQLHFPLFEDSRGSFVKTFQVSAFAQLKIETKFLEHFYSRSRLGVVRGLHFQLPPKAQNKLVYCSTGEVYDVVVDLRVKSPTYGQFESFVLSDEACNALYIPKGFAHGFAATSEDVVMEYLVSEEFSPELDSGIRWDSLDIPWPAQDPIVSDKDQSLTSFADFDSPFNFDEHEPQ